jgi:predicted HicB family RNase H-like nuclease
MKHAKQDIKKIASQYVKLVEWSDEDQCYVGLCPELFYGGPHGDSEASVYAELCRLVEEHVAEMLAATKPLPKAETAQKFSGKFVLRTGESLHKALAIRARRESKSLNQIVLDAIKHRMGTAA